jgi:hypothetical protein
VSAAGGVALLKGRYDTPLDVRQTRTLQGMNAQSCAIVEHHANLYPNKPTLNSPEDMALALRDPLLFREVLQTAMQQKDEKTVEALHKFAGYEIARIEAQQKIENNPVNKMLKSAETGVQLGGVENKLNQPAKP